MEMLEAERKVAVLTSMNRTEWAEAREEHFSYGLNKASLDQIESAMFMLVLDDNKPSTWTEEGKLVSTTLYCIYIFLLPSLTIPSILRRHY
jgi:hypothetical protein